MKTAIEKLWSLFYQLGRKECDEIDGELYHHAKNLIAHHFPDELQKVHKWSEDVQVGGSLYSVFTYKALSLPEKVIDGFRKEHILLHNFYFIEQFRIPLRCEPTLENIITVAYRIGQLSKWLKVRQFPEGLVHTYKNLNAHLMTNFVDENSITIPDELPKIAKPAVTKRHGQEREKRRRREEEYLS